MHDPKGPAVDDGGAFFHLGPVNTTLADRTRTAGADCYNIGKHLDG